MPKTSAAPAPPTTDTTFSCALTIPNKHLPKIQDGVPAGDTMGEKIAVLAEGAVLDLCEGGLMLNAPAMKRLKEALGHEPTRDEVIEIFAKGAGRKDGKLLLTVELDPAYESVAEAAAKFQGVDIPQLLQNCWATAWDNGDFYDPRPHVEQTRFTREDWDYMTKTFGKFQNGTELAALIRKHEAETMDPFEELGK